MRLILLGPPGCGKGTQAKLLSSELRLEHIGTGDLLRDAERRDTPLGQRVRPYLESGQLAPDDLVNEIVADRFRRGDRPERFVMDGYPRTLSQAQAFDAVLAELNLPVQVVVLLTVSDGEILGRLGGRWSCPKSGCKRTYHSVNSPPKVQLAVSYLGTVTSTVYLCDDCGTVLIQRDDDKPATVRKRLDVYRRETLPLAGYYGGRGLLHEVKGEGPIEQVHAAILKILEPLAGALC